MKRQPTIAEVGVYPPPYGGISVHIERLCDVLHQRGIAYQIYDENGESGPKKRTVIPIGQVESWCRKYLFQRNADIVHNHFLRWQVRFLLSLLRLKGKKVVHTIHSMRNDGEGFDFIQKLLIKVTALLSDHFIAVSEEVEQKLLEIGIPQQKISVIPAFIPPPEGEPTPLPAYVEQFVARYATLIVANGGIGNHYEGVDLYGADLCVELFLELAQQNENCGFIYAITHIVDRKSLDELKERLAAYNLTDRFLFLEEKMPLHPLIRAASLFVRPTASDGDAISVREALYVGTPVVTSDVVRRPAGARLFKNRDLADFKQACLDELEQQRDLSAYREQQGQYVEHLLNVLLK
ncbi:hypothetical protein BEP19_05220 [Ammoniphilus oxalaticus]|uniref:Glycosyltransferase subfamily 4-like N-terminal domain-containing protein n=1 Tax=Ammoniphilus oxalaticus TaxID=66863 RepID=A0A419SII9_9BACL|nr:glycosyltransferase family 4 protein [Ammoniphilus oxalaticus]RKD23831.1 hypothetical protein BEP19_05220 [Ammoniphilus oxalaticus]